jgi:TonB family protein
LTFVVILATLASGGFSMSRFLIAIICLFVGSATALAWQEVLPETVTTPYLAYEAALGEQDYVTAEEAAREAWLAAKRARVADETIGALATNYGELARALGHYEQAYEAWRQSAEIADDLDDLPVERAWRWHNASMSAFLDGDMRDARRCSTRATNTLDRAEDRTGMDPAVTGDMYFLRARLEAAAGRFRAVNRPAQQAVEAFEQSNREFDLAHGAAFYMQGLGLIGRDQWAEAYFSMHMAQHIYERIDGQTDASYRSEALARYAYSRLSRSWNDDLDEAFSADAAHARFPEHETPIAHEDDIERPGFVDAEAVDREAPEDPMEALREGYEGVVIVRYDIDASGRPENVEVLAEVPGGMFSEAATEAMSEWRYAPATQDGVAVAREDAMMHFMFQIGDRRR